VACRPRNSPDPAVIEVAHAAGALVNWQVASVPEAVAGVDLVTAQGMEAGGHVRGETALLPLLTAVLEEVGVPVLAAGGTADPRGLAAVLAAGAAAARIGTRFIATAESGAHPDYVAGIIAAGPGSTEITGAFAKCPPCATSPRARVLRSAIAAVEALDVEVVGTMAVSGEEMSLPRRFGMPPHRAVSGRIDAMPLYAGESVPLISSVEPAAQVARMLVDGAESRLRTFRRRRRSQSEADQAAGGQGLP
jgi:NAD(P)H-dependent flavin oxidoreductase YrpB (nitropropane dioxygenase family)